MWFTKPSSLTERKSLKALRSTSRKSISVRVYCHVGVRTRAKALWTMQFPQPSPFPQKGEMWGSLKGLRQAGRCIGPSVFSASAGLSALLPPYSLAQLGDAPRLWHLLPGDINWGLVKQVGTYSTYWLRPVEALSTQKESSPQMDIQSFYKRLKLVCLDLSRAKGQVWIPEHEGKCLIIELSQLSGKK
jgi:hypothetical protein